MNAHRSVFTVFTYADVTGTHSLILGIFRYLTGERFDLQALFLSREVESRNDALAIAAHGPNAFLRGMIVPLFRAEHLSEQLKPRIHQWAAREPSPPADAFERILEVCTETVPHASAAAWLRAEIQKPPEPVYPSPTTAQRLHACGVTTPSEILQEPLQQGPALSDTASWLTPETRAQAIQAFNRVDQKNFSSFWEPVRGEMEILLAEANALSKETAPSAAALWRQARLTLRLQGEHAIKGPVDQILALDPTHIPARFYRAKRLLPSQADIAIPELEALSTANLIYGEKALDALTDHARAHGDTEALAACEANFDEFMLKAEPAIEAMQKPYQRKEDLQPVHLHPVTLAGFHTQLTKLKHIHTLRMGIRSIPDFPGSPVYIVAYKLRGIIFSEEKLLQKLEPVLSLYVDDHAQFTVFPHKETNIRWFRALKKRLKKDADLYVHKRDRKRDRKRGRKTGGSCGEAALPR